MVNAEHGRTADDTDDEEEGNHDEIEAAYARRKVAEESSHRHMAIKALLKVAGNSARTSSIAGDLKPPRGNIDVKSSNDATIFDFYSSGGSSTVSRHVAPVRTVVYKEGPDRVMAKRRAHDKKARAMVEKLEWPKDPASQALKAEALLELMPGQEENFMFRWIHLPANNVR